MTLPCYLTCRERRVFLSALGLGALAATGLVGAPALAAPEPDELRRAEQLVRETVDAVFVVLRDPALAKDSKRRMQRLRETVDPVFDWVVMATSSLGHHWRKLSEAERARFVAAFKELLARRYMDDIDRFRGTEQVTVSGSEKSGELLVVKTVLVTHSRERIPMDYRLQRLEAGQRVVDLAIEGVSLVNHYRSTFSRYLVNKTIGELLAQLERQLGA